MIANIQCWLMSNRVKRASEKVFFDSQVCVFININKTLSEVGIDKICMSVMKRAEGKEGPKPMESLKYVQSVTTSVVLRNHFCVMETTMICYGFLWFALVITFLFMIIFIVVSNHSWDYISIPLCFSYQCHVNALHLVSLS